MKRTMKPLSIVEARFRLFSESSHWLGMWMVLLSMVLGAFILLGSLQGRSEPPSCGSAGTHLWIDCASVGMCLYSPSFCTMIKLVCL
jgi:hypothetical protein